jgi:hypothetical protein
MLEAVGITTKVTVTNTVSLFHGNQKHLEKQVILIPVPFPAISAHVNLLQ